MHRNNIFTKIFYPHFVVILIFLPITIASLIFSLKFLNSTSPFAIISYILSTYLLVVLCLKIPKVINHIKQFNANNKYASRWFNDVQLRMKVSLYASLLLNVLYAILQLGLGFYHNSLWFYSMAGYYFMLALIRYFLADYTKTYQANENEEKEIQKSLICGFLLLIMNIALGVVVALVVLQNKVFNYDVITTIALATYTFVSFTLAIVSCIKFRKFNSLVYSSAKSISLITSTVSMLTLESIMLSTFGDGKDLRFSKVVLSTSGAVVVIFSIIVAVLIILKANKKRLLKQKLSKGVD